MIMSIWDFPSCSILIHSPIIVLGMLLILSVMALSLSHSLVTGAVSIVFSTEDK